MKIIRILLLVLIIIGIGLLATQKIWVSPLVTFLLKSESKKWEVVEVVPQSVATSSTKKKTIPTPSITDNQIFSVPALYQKYKWNVTLNTDRYSGSWPLISIDPEMDLSKLSTKGTMYYATNTDPNVISWSEYNNNVPKDEPGAFYGGEEEFLTYYDSQLSDLGYISTRIYLDEDLNVLYDGQNHYPGTSSYSIIDTGDADGPMGTSRGYFKYNKGKVRVIIVSSSVDSNSIFISEILNLRDIIPLK
jgi:hypothetical protein